MTLPPGADSRVCVTSDARGCVPLRCPRVLAEDVVFRCPQVQMKAFVSRLPPGAETGVRFCCSREPMWVLFALLLGVQYLLHHPWE